MKKTPIEVSGLRKAPAIVVNPGDEIRVAREWFTVERHSEVAGFVIAHLTFPYPVTRPATAIHVDSIEEWRKG